MGDGYIHGKRRAFSASNVRDTIAETLQSIKVADSLTYSDMGRVLGKSGDRAEAYCNGDFSDMSGFSLLLAWREWNGRFIGPLREFVEQSRPTADSDRKHHTTILEAVLALSKALEEDDEVTADEVRDIRHSLENARDAITAQLAKLGGPKGAVSNG